MKVGFIGLGIMGKPMAKNLLKAGHDVYVNDLNKDAVAELVAAGAHAGESNADVAKNVEVVITMVPNSPHVRAAVLGEGGVIEGATSDTVIIDMSSIDPVESKKIAAELKVRKVLKCWTALFQAANQRLLMAHFPSCAAAIKKFGINIMMY